MKAHQPNCEPEQCHCQPDTKYFTDGTNIWKFEPGEAPTHRFKEYPLWDESAFTSLAEFEASPGDTWEIDQEDAEP